MDQIQGLTRVYQRLKQLGSAKLSKAVTGPGGLHRHVLRFQMDSLHPNVMPINGSADFEFAYDEANEQWTAIGTLFGHVPKANDPKAFLSLVRNSIRELNGIQQAFYERAMFMAERYKGDVDQFVYKLGVDTTAQGSIDMFAVGPMAGHWFTNREGYTFDVWFSRPNKPTPFGYTPDNRFGFFEPVATHNWSIEADDFAQVRRFVDTTSSKQEKLCDEINACLQ